MAVKNRNTMRARRHLRIRKKVSGTTERPRFCVSITANHIYCQFIDDVKGVTLACTSSLDPKFKAENAKPNMARRGSARETRGGGGQGRERHGSRF